MKSKTIRIPFELVEIIENRDPGKQPGDALLEIVKDYVNIENYARSLKLKQTGNEPVSEIIIRYHDWQDANTANVKEQIIELKTMIKGLEIFYTKFNKEK